MFLEFKLVSNTIYNYKNINFFGNSKNIFEKSEEVYYGTAANRPIFFS